VGANLRAVLAALTIALAVAGCSPEASRARSGGPGADVGNRPNPSVDPLPDIHGSTDPAYGTPQLGQASAK